MPSEDAVQRPGTATRDLNAPPEGPGTNTGHGHIWPRPDGVRARCGGAAMCKKCQADAARWQKVVTWVDTHTAETALPAEPPNGTVLRGRGGEVWVREDDENEPGIGAWFVSGESGCWRWPEAVAIRDAPDPTCRLVEVPDPDDADAVMLIAGRSSVSDFSVARVLRALTGQGGQQ